MPVDLGQLACGEITVPQSPDAVLDLFRTAGADQRRGDASTFEHPGKRQLRQRLPASSGDGIERPDALERAVVEERLPERRLLRRAAGFGDSAKIFVGEHALRQR